MTTGVLPETRTSAPPAPGAGRTRWLRVGRTLGIGVLTMFLVSVLVFFATQALPGDIAQIILGRDATPESLATLRAQLGLDRPVIEQYFTWIAGVLRGDFGVSLSSGQPVTTYLGGRILNSATLVVFTMVISLPLSIVAGVFAARHKDGWFDKALLAGSSLVNSLPMFVLGTLLVVLLGTTVFPILPPVSIIPPGDLPWWHPAELVLPVTTLVLLATTYLARLVRSTVIDVLDSEYIQMATLKGLKENRIVYRHALVNAIGPTLQAAAMTTAVTLGGVVVIEFVFAYPGIGTALTDAISKRDIPVIQAVVLLIAVVFYLCNLLADVIQSTLGPRSR